MTFCFVRTLRVFAGTAVLSVACLSNATAQSVTGSIQGTVVDQSGAVLPGVTLTIVNTATGATRTAVTNAQGLFAAELLPAGTYEVTASLAGFTTQRLPDVPLTVGQRVTLRVQMSVAAVAETLTVSGASPVLETTRSEIASTVNATTVANMPVNGRNFIDFVLLTPGVTRDVRGGDISFAGQRGTLNSLVVDGADDNNTFFGQTVGRTGSGRAPYQFSQEAVQEFQVNSSSYAAEYGRAGGAVINVVTKSGTNEIGGSVFEFYRDKALNANNYVNELRGRAKPPYHYNQFGAVIGGPIRRDRDFFFFNYDGQRNTQPNPVFLNLPSTTPRGDPATEAAIATLTPKAESWVRGQDQNVFLLKTDHQPSERHRLTLRYNHQNFVGRNFENGGTQRSLEATGDSKVFTRSFNATVASVFGNALFNEAKVQWLRDEEPGFANSSNPEATIFQGTTQVLVIGRNNFSPRETTIKRWQFADALTWVTGTHKVKTGADVQFDDILNHFPGFFSGSYTFRTLASFAGGRPGGQDEFYQQNFEGPGTSGPLTHPDIREVSFFAQDEWRVTSDVALNAGLRYDVMKTNRPPVRNPDPDLAARDIDTSRLDTDTNNWAPRVGIAWSPEGRKYILRAGWGVFYGRTPAIMLGTAHSNNGINIVSLTFTGDAVPTYPNRFSTIPSGGRAAVPTIFYIDKDFANPRVMQASGGVEWEFLPRTSLAVNYLFVDGTSLPRSVDKNLGPLTEIGYALSSGETLRYHQFGSNRPFRNFGRVIAFESTAESRYNGMTVELNRHFLNGLQVRGAYTLGKVIDTAPDATAVVPGNAGDDVKYVSNPVNFEADRTVGNNDQRHRLVLSGVYSTDRWSQRFTGARRAMFGGWAFSWIFTAQTGQPYSARVGSTDLNNDLNTRNDLAPGTVRNQFRFPGTATVDSRVARTIDLAGRTRLTLIVEAFNLFNDDIISSVDTAFYAVSIGARTLTPNPGFGAPLSSVGERVIQLAVKLGF